MRRENFIWASHTYGILKMYNVNLNCDVSFWWIVMACCLAKIVSLTPRRKVI